MVLYCIQLSGWHPELLRAKAMKNLEQFATENNLFEPAEMTGRNGKTYYTFENSKSEVVVYNSDLKIVSEEEQEKELF